MIDRVSWMTALLAAALVAGCEEGPPPAAEPGPAEAPASPAPMDPLPAEMPEAPEPEAPAEPEPEEVPDDPDPVEEPEAPRPPRAFVPSAPVMTRLTAEQYRNTVEDVFGPGLPRVDLEADTNPYLFYTIGAATTDVSARGVEQYTDAAFTLARAVFGDEERRRRIMDCDPVIAVDRCTEDTLRRIGHRLYRRALTEDEVRRWLEVSRAAWIDDPLEGLETAVAGLLQSPVFLYRAEAGEPHPDLPERQRYTSHEMATRLAFLLTDSGPDDALLAAAERGELLDDATLTEHTERLLQTPRARDAVQAFFTQYLDLKRLRRIELDPAVYVGFSPELLAAMETEIRLLVDAVVFRERADIRELFGARRGYVNRDLAALYGVDAPGATRSAFVPVFFPPEIPRAGILTLGAFLTMNAHPTETSPTLRGKYVRERVLCQNVPPPPDDVNLDLSPSNDEAPTLRERLEQHREDPACRSCHAFIDPPGFLFEHFDSMGRWRAEVDGYAVDASGDLDGIELYGAEDLGEMLRDDPRVGRCIARQLFRHANARLDTIDDRPVIEALHAEMAESGYVFDRLVLALVLSEGFRTVAPPDDGAEVEDDPNDDPRDEEER